MPTLSTPRRVGALGALVAAATLLAACSAGTAPSAPSAASTARITDNFGEIEVPVNPQRVVALDNTVFQTLSDWNIPLVAAPKDVIGSSWPQYTEASVLNVGSHREPNLETIVEANPDLVIGGYRFASYYDQIKALAPTTIEINPRDGQEAGAELKRQTTILGEIFDRADDAAAVNAAYDTAVAEAKSAYNGTDRVIAVIVSGGEISYVAPAGGRSLGVLFPTLGLVPGIDQAAEDTSHGDDISVEAIAAANPDWLIVLDREGGFAGEGYVPAAEVIAGSEALKNVAAVQKGQILYADPSFYLQEGIQSYTKLYTDTAAAFQAAT